MNMHAICRLVQKKFKTQNSKYVTGLLGDCHLDFKIDELSSFNATFGSKFNLNF